MTAVAYLFGALALVVAVLLAVAVVRLDRAQEAVAERDEEIDRLEKALGSEKRAHETTREEFRATALEADRNAERVADLEAQLHDAWERSGEAVIERARALANLAMVLGEAS